jgi:nucleotide-binding universal stress UspA family protein
MQQVQTASAQCAAGAAAKTSPITPFRQAAVTHTPPKTLSTCPADSVFVVGVDASPSARSALSVAAGLARSLGGSLVLMHALVPTSPPTCGSACGALRIYRAELRDAEALLCEAANMASDVVNATELRFGDPAEAICQLANDVRAELIVVGSRGLGRLNRLLLGSVSRGVVERAPCSVLVVRAGVSAGGSAASVLEGATQ